MYALIASGFFSLATGALINDEGDLSGSLEGVAILASVAIVVLVSAINDYQKESQFQELNAAKEEVQVIPSCLALPDDIDMDCCSPRTSVYSGSCGV